MQDFVDELNDRVRRDAVSTATATFPAYIVTGVLMLFFLAYGKRYFDGFVEQLPESRQTTCGPSGTTPRCAGAATS